MSVGRIELPVHMAYGAPDHDGGSIALVEPIIEFQVTKEGSEVIIGSKELERLDPDTGQPCSPFTVIMELALDQKCVLTANWSTVVPATVDEDGSLLTPNMLLRRHAMQLEAEERADEEAHREATLRV